MRFLMFSNRDDALPLSETDRRVYAVRCTDKPRDESYYKALYALLADANFLAAAWQLLRTRNIAHFNPGRRAPLNEMKLQMINAGRTDEQQTAAEFVKACPYEVVAANELVRVLVPQGSEERDHEWKVRMSAVTAVLRELGAQTYPRKLKVKDTSTRVWMLRNPSRWSQATPAALGQEVSKAHDHFVAHHWKLDAITEAWGYPP